MKRATLITLALAPLLASCASSSPQRETAAPVPPPASGTWTAETTVGTIVAERPETARIFELVGIDYCCGGETPLGLAAAPLDVDTTSLLRALAVVNVPPGEGASRDWQQAELDELIEHIVSTHHVWLRRELPQLAATAETVYRVHGETHPELAEVVATINEVQVSVLPHLDDEEQRVFPVLLELNAGGSPEDVDALLDELHGDHDELGDTLHRLRALTNGYTPPPDACAKYLEMLDGLAALEADMYTHVHLENNVLLPRARALAAGR